MNLNEAFNIVITYRAWYARKDLAGMKQEPFNTERLTEALDLIKISAVGVNDKTSISHHPV